MLTEETFSPYLADECDSAGESPCLDLVTFSPLMWDEDDEERLEYESGCDRYGVRFGSSIVFIAIG